MDVFDFFASLGVDTKNRKSGSFYTKCPKCHDERKKQSAKEFLVNLDTGYCECFHCGYTNHILSSPNFEKTKFVAPPPIPQAFIEKEPAWNWSIPDSVLEPEPKMPLRGIYHVTWYYRDIQGRLTGAKKMEYNFHEDGFNRTEAYPIHLFSRDNGFVPCMFYERDLSRFPTATVILLESEKTAAIMRRRFKDYLKDYIYLAVGGANGLTDQKAKVLAGRTVLICYDCDNGELQEDGTIKKPKGREGAQSAHTKLAGICQSFVVDIDPSRTDGADLADLPDIDIDFIRGLHGTQKYPAELVDTIRAHNRAGDYWTKKLSDEVGAKVEVDHSKVYEIGRVYYQANTHEFGIDQAPLLKKIEYFLLQRYEFRRNSINRKIFYRDKLQKDAEFVFCNYNDVWRLLQHNVEQFGKKARVNITDVSNLLESDFVPEINPFVEYFHGLPHWDGTDHITKLANYIQTTDQPFWVEQFKEALIRMIACTYGGIENRIIMVLVQPAQEQGKDSFIRFLCPPQLKEYYKEDPMTIGKDSEIALCQNFLWNLTELDSLNKKEISEIKGIISRAHVKQRRAYGRQEENMLRVVNFWGTTNKEEFLTDTQNTRWLCFRIDSIDHKYNDYINNIREINITKVWAQAWYLYKKGDSFMLNTEERRKRDIINHQFEYMSPEKQLIIKFLTPATKETLNAEFVTVVEILQYLIAQTENKVRLAPENVGRAMTQLGFEGGTKKINKTPVRGYYALRQPLLKSVNYNPPTAYEPEDKPQMLTDADLPF